LPKQSAVAAAHSAAMKHSAANITQRSLRERTLDALPVTERRLSLNGVSTAVIEGGDGPPILVLHGPSGYAAHWREIIPELVTTNRVIAPDLPGHGASEPFAGVPSYDTAFGWLDDLIECTCATPPIVVGHGLGGGLAARFAAERSLRLRALVLVDALGLTTFEPEPAFGAALQEFLAAPADRTHDQLWKQCVFDLASLESQLGSQWSAIKAYNLDCAQAPGALAAVSHLMGLFGVPAIPQTTLARIRVPTALLWGRADRATPLRVARAASERFGWELRVIDGAGADPALEQPRTFVAQLRELIGQMLPQAQAS
jgi:pimeloyl-ACP methyl ester carboxylesterase